MQELTPKVSVVMPALNVAKYIRPCIESVINQTLKDIEIILVDAGSTDGTLDIIQEYVGKDSRVSLINSEKKSYGYQMNIGFAAARGEYFGIVETDDYADSEMFETLYNCAKKNDLDVVKSGFYFYYSKDGDKNIPNPIASRVMANHTFCPTTFFKCKRELVEFFNIKPTIWSAVYKASFIRENNILFNETPGASYQDCSFNFKVWTCAQRVQLLQDCFLHYRQDNEGSSINSKGKVYCICDEYDEIERFLTEERPVEKGKLMPLMVRLKYDSYNWNLNRLDAERKMEFIMKFHTDFLRHEAEGDLQKVFFEYYKWNSTWEVINDPLSHLSRMVNLSDTIEGEGIDLEDGAGEKNEKVQQLRDYEKLNHIRPRVFRMVAKGIYMIKRHGLTFTLKYTKNKIMWRMKR